MSRLICLLFAVADISGLYDERAEIRLQDGHAGETDDFESEDDEKEGYYIFLFLI